MEEFWRIVRDGVETVADYPGGRLPLIDRAYASKEGVATVRGGFLPAIDRFDADFFGISPREATFLDPQQRLLLEVAWESIEDAGIPAARIAGTQTGVFAGLWSGDYESCLLEQAEVLDFYATIGTGRYPASGRLAYFFDLRGPTLTLDTACSSTLVAIHLACRSLREGESDMALAGGANIILRPELTTAYSNSRILSPDGRSKFGDASANGYVRSEGAAMLLLKPLSRAIADGDPVYAVIRGSAVNNDGRAGGALVAPSREGQESVLRRALQDANVDAGAIDYVEAHGTGTPVGDPIEIETIGCVVDTDTRRRPCLVGSVKTNIGHTEAAAGAAGVIKTALALERGIVPASLHLSEPNPSIAWSRLPLSIPTASEPWPHAGPVRLAGVNGFGITGTNAHVVLENADVWYESAYSRKQYLFVLSAQSQKALEAQAKSWLAQFESDPSWPPSLADLAYTSTVRRSQHDFRLAVVAASREELRQKLAQWLQGEQTEKVIAGRKLPLTSPKKVFVFAGHGAQWAGMARGLFDEEIFRKTLDDCDAAIRKFAGWSVVEQLLSGAMPHEACIAQPCLFAVMVSLAELWKSLGVEPDAVVGHSMGECAAAVVCGALSLEDGAAIISGRSRLMTRVSGKGGMLFTALPLEDAAALARQSVGRLSVAVSNSLAATVLSGDPDAIEEVTLQLNERGVFCRRVRVDVASHSAQMDPLLPELEEAIREIQPRHSAIPFYSTVTARVEDGAALDPEYWSKNLRHPVMFSATVENLLRDGFDAFVEISPHPLLVQSIEEIRAQFDKPTMVASSLRSDGDDLGEILHSLGALYVSGLPVDFAKLYPKGRCLRLSPYPFQRERYWLDAEKMREPRQLAVAPATVADTGQDIYELHWREADVRSAANATGLWIVMSGAGAVATPLMAQMESAGSECVRVGNVEELERALEAVGGRCRGVIRISAMESADAHEAATETMEIVRTVRTVARGTGTPLRLWLVTTGVWHLASDRGEVHAAQSPAWGLGRVIEKEHPELRSVNADLSASPDGKEIAILGRLICGNGSEEQIAVRGEKYLVARYERMAKETGGAVALRADASYLITGGLGGIGLHLAEWLVKNGARHIALVSRRQPDDVARQRIAAIEATGATVRVFSADLADDDQIRAMLTSIQAELPPLKGVFHLAAAYEGALLGDVETAGLHRVMRSKADGAWALDRHLNGLDVDYFVLFSSVAAAISQPGLASYAAANAYIEALARYRRTRGLKAQSVQWGSWLSTGLSNDPHVQDGVRIYQAAGIQPIAVEDALHALAEIMLTGKTDVLALPVSWDQFARSFANAAPPRAFLDLLPKAEIPRGAEASEAIGEKLLALEPARRRTALEAHLREKLAAVLKTDAARIDPARPFGAMGLDSLMGLEFVRRLSVTTGLRLPVTTVYNYSTIQTFAREIARRMSIPLATAPLAEPHPTDKARQAGASSVAGMTDDEAIEALIHGGPRAV